MYNVYFSLTQVKFTLTKRVAGRGGTTQSCIHAEGGGGGTTGFEVVTREHEALPTDGDGGEKLYPVLRGRGCNKFWTHGFHIL